MKDVIQMNTAEHSPNFSVAHRTAADFSSGPQEYLSFCLGGEEYGIDILKVQEIRGFEQPTRMTGAPEFVKGVLNLRGVIVPILDLRLKFGIPDPSYDALTVTVILALDHFVVGIVVDSVSDVVEFAPEQVKRVPEFSGYVTSTCITGIGTLEQSGRDRMLILLNIEKLMGGSDMGLIQPALQ